MTKARTAVRALGITGLLAIALTRTSGCICLGNDLAIGADSSQTSMNDPNSALSDVDYSIKSVEVRDSAHGDGGKAVAIRWHAVNNSSMDTFADGYYFKVYQNKQVMSVGSAAGIDARSDEVQELAPGGEYDGTSVYYINDLSPIEVKYIDPTNQSVKLDQTFNLE